MDGNWWEARAPKRFREDLAALIEGSGRFSPVRFRSVLFKALVQTTLAQVAGDSGPLFFLSWALSCPFFAGRAVLVNCLAAAIGEGGGGGLSSCEFPRLRLQLREYSRAKVAGKGIRSNDCVFPIPRFRLKTITRGCGCSSVMVEF